MTLDLSHITPGLHPLAVPLTDIHPDPANVRVGHDVDGIAASLLTYGQRTPLVCNRQENGRILKGNGTYQAARQLGWTHIAVLWVEDDRLTAVGYSIADNRLGDLSHFDEQALAAVLGQLPPETVTGFDEAALAAAVQADSIDPSLIVEDDRYQEQYGVIILCDDEAHQQTIYEQLSEQGYSCKVVVT